MNGKELLNFANKLEDDNKDKGYKWLYDKLRYEIIKKHQEAINFIPCCTELPKIELLTLDGFIFSHFNKLKGNQYIRKTDYKIFSLENITLEYDRLKII